MLVQSRHATRYGAALLAAGILLLAGCGSTVQGDSKLTVYVSTAGARGSDRGDLRAGARDALGAAGSEAADVPIELVSEPAGGDAWTQAGVAASARAATEDSMSVAYMGEADPAATLVSTPITNEAGLLQVAPGSLPRELMAEPGGNDVPTDVQTTGTRTLGAIEPAYRAQVHTIEADSGGESLAYRQGYTAMQAILDAIGRAEDPLSRADVVDAFMSTSGLETKLGTLSIGPDGAAFYDSRQG